MAVNAKDIPITREDVHQWIIEAKDQYIDKETYIRSRIDNLHLKDRKVNTSHRDDFNESEVDIADMVIADLDSYA